MKAKLGLIVCMLSVIVFYGVHTTLFLIAILNTVIHLSADFARAYIIAKPATEKYKEAVKQMYYSGATEEEIKELDHFPVEPEDYDAVPNWLPFLIWVTHVISIILLIAGLIIRF